MEKMINLLRRFNFNESEAKVYITLLQSGPCTGYEASKLSGVPRSKIYNILEILTNRGVLVKSDGEKSTLWRAEPINHLKNLIKSSMEDSLKELDEEAQKFESPKEDEKIWHLFDYKSIINKCLEMIQQAKSKVLVQIWIDDLDDRLTECLNEKIYEMKQVLIILYDSSEKYNTQLKKFYPHGFEEEKMRDFGHRWITITCDGKEMTYALIRNSMVSEAIYTKNESMIFFADEYIYHDAYCLRLIERFGDQIRKEFGEDMGGVRDIFAAMNENK